AGQADAPRGVEGEGAGGVEGLVVDVDRDAAVGGGFEFDGEVDGEGHLGRAGGGGFVQNGHAIPLLCWSCWRCRGPRPVAAGRGHLFSGRVGSWGDRGRHARQSGECVLGPGLVLAGGGSEGVHPVGRVDAGGRRGGDPLLVPSYGDAGLVGEPTQVRGEFGVVAQPGHQAALARLSSWLLRRSARGVSRASAMRWASGMLHRFLSSSTFRRDCSWQPTCRATSATLRPRDSRRCRIFCPSRGAVRLGGMTDTLGLSRTQVKALLELNVTRLERGLGSWKSALRKPKKRDDLPQGGRCTTTARGGLRLPCVVLPSPG